MTRPALKPGGPHGRYAGDVTQPPPATAYPGLFISFEGGDGVGKTTLLQILVGELEATGRLKIGSRVKIGYFSQQHEGLDPSKTILDEICYTYGLDEETARNYLGAFLFHGDDVLRLIGALSGGEQARVAFLKLMLTDANFLVLDEPTNHLDIKYQLQIMDIVRGLDLTVAAAIHDLNIAALYCDRLIAIKNGMVVGYGTPIELLTEDFIYTLYEVHAKVEHTADGHLYIRYLPQHHTDERSTDRCRFHPA